MKKVIMLHAAAQSGKNTVADIIKDYAAQSGLKTIIIAEADYVKFTLDKYYGITEFKTEEGRSIIQKYATDKCRGKDPLIWSRVLTTYLSVIQDDFDIAVIPDWRFNNEYDNMAQTFGVENVIKVLIERPDVNKIDNMTNEQRQHQSEIELDNFENYDYRLLNLTNNLDFLKNEVKQLLNTVLEE